MNEEEEIEELENQFPLLAAGAFAAAFQSAQRLNQDVLIAEDGFLINVHPDGSRTVLRAIEKPTPAKVGTRFILR